MLCEAYVPLCFYVVQKELEMNRLLVPNEFIGNR
jgi:hypothetical protein